MSSSELCNCDQSLAQLFICPVRNIRSCPDIGATPINTEKLDTLRREAAFRSREFARHGLGAEAMEWAAVAKWLGAYC